MSFLSRIGLIGPRHPSRIRSSWH